MPWSTRMKIALDAAKGLAFLHEADKPVIYRDFKTSNILLDSVCSISFLKDDKISSSGLHHVPICNKEVFTVYMILYFIFTKSRITQLNYPILG